jgi:hypothetical protein
MRAVAVAVATVLCCWPALWNGYPLFGTDAMDYLADGAPALQMLRHPGAFLVAATRSELYSIVLCLVDGNNATPWPIVFLQSLLTAWVLWLVVRSLVARWPVSVYLGLIVVLNLLTSVGWYVSYINPDTLGPVLYLSLYVLVFAAELLRRWEIGLLMVVACWTATAHGTHLLLGGAICCLLSGLWLLRWRGLRGRGRGLVLAAAVVLLAAASQMAVHRRMYGRATLFGYRPPFLMARFLADGPAREFLQQHCAGSEWVICRHVQQLPEFEWMFLWKPDGIWQTASTEERRDLSREEMPLVRATLRAYPLQQARRSLENLGDQMVTLGLYHYAEIDMVPRAALEHTMPGLYEAYQRTRQRRDLLHESFFRAVYPAVAWVSLVVALGLVPWTLRNGDRRLVALAVVVLFVVPANAFVTGVLSGVYARYQDRVVWLWPLLAALMGWSWWTGRARPSAAGRSEAADVGSRTS